MFCPTCHSGNLIRCGWDYGKQRWQCKRCNHKSCNPIEDIGLIKENVKLAKQKQSFQDLNRIERKAFREYARIENAVSKYTNELVKIFDNYELSKLTLTHEQSSSAVGVIQFSDVHFNELVDLEHNKYDFTIASKRCKYFVTDYNCCLLFPLYRLNVLKHYLYILLNLYSLKFLNMWLNSSALLGVCKAHLLSSISTLAALNLCAFSNLIVFLNFENPVTPS